MTFEVKECRSCAAKIIWCVTHKGKRMPVDAQPVPTGNIRLRQEGDRVIAEYPGKEHPSLLEDERQRFVSHFSSCPDRQEWRREKA